MLHTQGPGQDFGHYSVIDEAGGEGPRVRLSRGRNVGLWETAARKEPGKIGICAPGWLRRQRASRSRIQFALKLRRQSDGCEVLEFHIIGDAETAANRRFPISAGIESETHPRGEIVLVRLRVSEGDDAGNVG